MSHRSSKLIALLPLLVLAVPGCTTVSSEYIESPYKRDAQGKVELEGNEPKLRPILAGANEGIAYFLPRQLAKVTATRSNSKVNKGITNVTSAKTKLAAAEAQLLVEDQKLQIARDKLRTAEGSEAQRLAREELVYAEGRQQAQKQARDKAQTALVTASQALSDAARDAQSGSLDNAEVTVAISLLPPTADTRFGYRLSPRHSVLRDDDTKFVLGSNGLLNTSNITATDRTADALAELGSLAGALFGVPGGGTLGLGRLADGTELVEETCEKAPKSYTETIDLAVSADVKKLNMRLTCLGARLHVPTDKSWLSAGRPVGDNETRQDQLDGIIYRTPVDVPVTVFKRVPVPLVGLTIEDEALGRQKVKRDKLKNAQDALKAAYEKKQEQLEKAEAESKPPSQIGQLKKESADAKAAYDLAKEEYEKVDAAFQRGLAAMYPNKGWVPTETVSLRLPQAGPISVLPQDAGLFTKTEYSLVFDNGILTKYESNRPSEVLAVVSAPMKIINGLFDGISKIISIRTGRANDLAGLSQAELNLQNALAAEERGLIENQRLLSVADLALVNQLTQAQLANLNNAVTLSQADQARIRDIIAAEFTADIARLNARSSLAAADQALINTLSIGQNSLITNETTVYSNLLLQLQQQNALAVAQAGAPSQLGAALNNDFIQRQRQIELRNCVDAQIEAQESIEICLQ